MTECACSAAGYCARHAVHKTDRWLELCRTRQDYWSAWEAGRGPGQPVDYRNPAELARDRIERFRGLWSELHSYAPAEWSKVDTAKWLDEWIARIPSFGCSCKGTFRDLLTLPGNMPNLESAAEFFEWTVRIHNAVNQKLGKPNLALQEAEKHWGRNRL
jgi:hypothetical protein